MKNLFTLYFLVVAYSSNAQSYYSHSTTTGATYQELVNPTVIFSHPWDHNDSQIEMSPISNYYGFDLTYLNGYLINAYGALGIANASYSSFFAISGVYANLVSRTTGGNSEIAWLHEGTAPNRITKVQWKNASFEADTTSFVNFQLWYYEVDGTVEIHYGANSVSTQSYGVYPGPVIGLSEFASAGTTSKGYHLYGDLSNPQAEETAGLFTATGTPADGTIYTFTNLSVNPTSVSEIDDNIITVWPNPVVNYLTFSEKVTEIVITDLKGSKILEFQNSNSIDLSSLDKGIYFLTFSDSDGNHLKKKILKQ